LVYAYDGNGNRTRITATVAGTDYSTTYEYDDASRLDLVTDPATRIYDHGYDANGNRTSLQHPNGTTTSYVYNSLNRLTSLGVTGPTGTVFSQAFTLGAAGNRTQIVENDGTTKDYSYDDLYRLTRDKVSDTVGTIYQKDFTYDAVGNRQQQTTLGTGAAGTPTAPGTIDYTYDTRDRLLTENANTLGYDTNGNLTSKTGEATYTWDFENRLKKVEKSDGTLVEYLYDADGNRVQTKTTPSGGSATTVNYLTDTSAGLSHVVAEVDVTTATPTLSALYVRGTDDLLSVMRPAGGGTWTSKFFHADGIGSIRRLTNESGTITDGYSYTAFGERIAHTGTDPQPYSFAGEPLDPNSGFQYHRARWMDPRSGRFTGMDPFRGLIQQPMTLHRYLYAGADPVGKADPTGKLNVDLGSALAGLLGGSTLRATSVVNYSATMRAVSALLVTAMVGTPLLTLDPTTLPQGAKATARIRLKSRIQERAKGREPVLFHYTDELSAIEIARSGVIIASERFVQDVQYTMPSGAFATDIPPYSPTMTQRQLSALFFAGNEEMDVSSCVAFVGPDFVPLTYAPYPNQWFRPAPAGTPVSITVLGHGPNLMAP
jgi:RHS repeat-associated protein